MKGTILKKVLVTLLGAPIVIRRPPSLRPAQHLSPAFSARLWFNSQLRHNI